MSIHPTDPQDAQAAMAPDPLRVRVTAESEAVPELRWAAGEFAVDCGADDGVAANVMLAVSEAVTNAVVHAYPDSVGEVEVVASVRDGALEVSVRDEGVGFRPGASEGIGAGMMLIGESADEHVIEEGPGGVTLTMRFLLRRPAA